MRSAWVSTVKWILLGAIGGSSLTAAWTMQRRGEKVDSPVPVLDRAPAPLSKPNAAALSPLPSVVDRPATTSRPERGRLRPSLRRHYPSPGETAEGHAGDETADKVVLDASTLAAEVARIDAARAASTTGDNVEAIRLIDRYHRDFPNGALAPDAAAGVQALAERFPGKPVYPGLNTQFLGILEEQATWTEKCIGCGECMLAEFGGVCPVTRCAKHMLNGPCGGSTSERCEVSADKPCAWQLIFKRLQSIGQLDRLEKIHPPKDWSKAWHGGARKIVRPEHRI
jgi:hypothetical protein